MSIIFRDEIQQFQLNTKNSSYIISLDKGYLTHLYWGARLPDEDHSGAQLINYGIPVNNEDEYVSQIFYLEKVRK